MTAQKQCVFQFTGMIDQVRSFQAQGGQRFSHIFLVKKEDDYGARKTFLVNSNRKIGAPGTEATVTVEVSGYVRKSRGREYDPHTGEIPEYWNQTATFYEVNTHPAAT